MSEGDNMLEFIVLGDIPVIHLQVTFSWVLLVMLIIASYALYVVEKPRLHQLRLKHAQSKNEQPAV